MRIIEITDLLTTGLPNYYVFNPSVLHLCDNIYLIAYRVISYDIPMQYHPWKIWDNGYKFFPVKPHEKYRDRLGPARVCELKSNSLVQTGPEVDTTALAVATFDGENFTIRHNICDLFPNEMNQDARLVYCDNIYSLIYNVFENDGIKLRCRDFTISISPDYSGQICFGPERYLFDHKYRNVEKHCAFALTRGEIMYSMGAQQETIVDGRMQARRVKCFDYLFDKFDKDILISLSTSLVKYKSGFIGCGHAKVLYKKSPPEMMKFVDISKIHTHGKYIYYMYLYETNAAGRILRASPMFIPTINDNHLPYLLAMPISLTTIGDNYLISYGEGDCKCKCLILSPGEIAYLLRQTNMPCFLTEKMVVNHVGYWGKFNCGDDAFMDVFKHLYQAGPHQAIFAETYSDNVHINVLGGGDVINDYFAKLPIPNNTIAVSVGIPYEEFITRLKHFRAVYLRNEADYKKLISQPKINYAPDLAFLMPKVYGKPAIARTGSSVKSIGIILARTYYNKDFPELYDDFCGQIAQFAESAHSDGFHLVFIPFCINQRKPGEDDNIIIRDVVAKLSFCPETFRAGSNYVKDTYFKISQMNFNICSRFHSHIFSTIHNVPFISLTCGRKCIEYMRIMPDCLYRLKANDVDLPIKFDGRQFYNFFKSKWWERGGIASRLQIISAELIRQADVFAGDYFKILRKHSHGAGITLWPGDLGCSPRWMSNKLGDFPDNILDEESSEVEKPTQLFGSLQQNTLPNSSEQSYQNTLPNSSHQSYQNTLPNSSHQSYQNTLPESSQQVEQNTPTNVPPACYQQMPFPVHQPTQILSPMFYQQIVTPVQLVQPVQLIQPIQLIQPVQLIAMPVNLLQTVMYPTFAYQQAQQVIPQQVGEYKPGNESPF